MKTMKKALVAMALILIYCGSAAAQDCFNAQGKALVPDFTWYYVSSGSNETPHLTVTNITGVPVRCKITLYDDQGNDISNYGRVCAGGTTNWTTVATNTGEFELPAHSSRFFYATTSGAQKCIVGYAVIQWTSDDPMLQNALIAGGHMIRSDVAARAGGKFFVNNGKPF